MPKSEQPPIEEMRVGMSETHAFMVFTPPLDKIHLSKFDVPQHPAEQNKAIKYEKKKRQVLIFPRGSFGWSSDEREAAFLHTSVTLGSELGVDKLQVGSLNINNEKPINELLQGEVEIVPLSELEIQAVV
jgi:hypothetical protein